MIKAASLALLIGAASAHMKLVEPEPRVNSNGITTGPCGDETGDWTGPVTNLEPGFNLVRIAINDHPNHVFRVSLSRVLRGNETDFDCVMLSHVPQIIENSTSDVQFNISIPDVDCSGNNLCALRVEMFPASSSSCCNRTAGDCGAGWYSCANVRINGTQEREGVECHAPCSWPYRDWHKDMFMSYDDTANAHWKAISATTYRLSNMGEWQQPMCAPNDVITAPTNCTDYWDTDEDGGLDDSHSPMICTNVAAMLALVVTLLFR
jgi:hypothetical protein